jgi:outer membrane protein assembly factor BamB
MSKCSPSYFLPLALALHHTAALAEDWPRWRGPELNGISREKDWFHTWPAAGPKQAWRANVGAGFSSVTVADGRLFTIGHGAGQETIYALDANTGKELWKQGYPNTFRAKYYEGGSSSTPVVDGQHVYSVGNMGDALCFEAASGKIVWKKNLQKELKLKVPTWGFAGSPLVENSLVFLNLGTAGLALNKATGQVVWQTGPKDSGYATPTPFDHAGKRAIAFFTASGLVSADPLTGRQLWRLPWNTSYDVNAADPIFSGGEVFLASGYGTGGGLTQIGAAKPAWLNKKYQLHFNSLVLVEGFLYGVIGQDGGACSLACIDFKTGVLKWAEKTTGLGSVTAADGKLIFLNSRGELAIVEAGLTGYKSLAKAQVLGGKCWTTPVLANGKIYCRNSKGDLVCIDSKETKAN